MRHSQLGASGAERWINCPGSVSLIRIFGIPTETEEPSYRKDGTTAHAGAALCLEKECDAWEQIGCGFDGEAFTADMAEGVQVYLDTCRQDFADADHIGIEQHLSAQTVHPALFGTTDCYVVKADWLTVNDYKNGKITVEVEQNPQIMYYAYLTLRQINDPRVKNVRLRIIQPNDFNPEGKVRVWETTADHIFWWAENVLVPAMERTDKDAGLEVGAHCRFCPAKLVCPAQSGLFGAISEADATAASKLTDEELDRRWLLVETAKFYTKAIETEVHKRSMEGHKFRNSKLVDAKADRVWKEGSLDRFLKEFGTKCYGVPPFNTPAQMEKLGPEAKKLTKEWAYTPKTGYRIAPIGDKGVAIKPPKASEVFAGAVENLKGE